MSAVPDEQSYGLLASTPTGAERVVAVRSARKDGHDVATLRCVERGGTYVVECEVRPVTSPFAAPARPGPYRFAAREHAEAFLDEAFQALGVLGCETT